MSIEKFMAFAEEAQKNPGPERTMMLFLMSVLISKHISQGGEGIPPDIYGGIKGFSAGLSMCGFIDKELHPMSEKYPTLRVFFNDIDPDMTNEEIQHACAISMNGLEKTIKMSRGPFKLAAFPEKMN